tara:strand:- start:169 stop:663 length:495 start_codon:yes stop_codon:yes gene_type:complete
MATDPITQQAVFGGPKVSLRHVGSYQISGKPFVTGSENLDAGKIHLVEFGHVCKSFTVINNNTTDGDDIRVHFSPGHNTTAPTVPGDAGAEAIVAGADIYVNFNYITIPAGNGSMTFDVKCSKFYISNPPGASANLKYQVIAELTGIDTRRMYELTGSGITGDA